MPDLQSELVLQWGKSQWGGEGKQGAGRGTGTGFARNLLAETPDGRQICFNFNTVQGCDGKCGRVHVCRRCLKDDHGAHEGKCGR